MYALPIDDQEALRLYNQKLSDEDIAQSMGHHPKSIARWRRRYGLKSNVGQGKHGKRKKIKERIK